MRRMKDHHPHHLSNSTDAFCMITPPRWIYSSIFFPSTSLISSAAEKNLKFQAEPGATAAQTKINRNWCLKGRISMHGCQLRVPQHPTTHNNPQKKTTMTHNKENAGNSLHFFCSFCNADRSRAKPMGLPCHATPGLQVWSCHTG